MTTKLLFSLGTGNYQPASYALDSRRSTTRFSAVATRELFDARAAGRGDHAVDVAYVLVTPESRAANLPGLQAVWPEAVPLHVLDVPSGGGVEDLWGIFTELAEVVEDGDRLVLDVTHGLRSMPMVALLVVAYMRAARRDAQLAMLAYGAYEATRDGETPMYDLTPLASLLDWSAAVQHLNRGGSAQTLADLIKEINAGLYRQPGLAAGDRPTQLSALASLLDRFASGLQSFRYEDVAETARQLEQRLDGALARDADRRAVRPLVVLKPALDQALAPFRGAGDGPPLTDLARQRALLDWLYERDLAMPYVALLSELLVGLVARDLGLYDLTDQQATQLRQAHHYAEKLLRGAAVQLLMGGEARAPMGGESGEGFKGVLAGLDHRAFIATLLASEHGPTIVKLSEEVRPLRNSLMHAGMSADAAPATGPDLRKAIAKLHDKVSAAPFFTRF